MSIFYPFVTLTCICTSIYSTHTHTRRSASVHSISIDRVLLCHHVHCSVHWFHLPVSASLHPSSFGSATHLFFHLCWKNLRLFQNVQSVSRPFTSLSPPSIIHLFVLSPVLHPYINVSILNWFSTQQCCISSIFSQFLHPHLQNISINAPCVPHFTPSSHHPLIFSSICAEKPAFVPYICILIRVWCWFSIQCASFHPFYPDLCIPHLKYLISTCLTSIYSSFIDTNHPYFLPFTLECLYVIHKSICWCICLVLGFPSNDSITFHIKVSHISLLPKTCHWTFFIPFFKPIFMLPIYPSIDPLILHWFSIHYA